MAQQSGYHMFTLAGRGWGFAANTKPSATGSPKARRAPPSYAAAWHHNHHALGKKPPHAGAAAATDVHACATWRRALECKTRSLTRTPGMAWAPHKSIMQTLSNESNVPRRQEPVTSLPPAGTGFATSAAHTPRAVGSTWFAPIWPPGLVNRARSPRVTLFFLQLSAGWVYRTQPLSRSPTKCRAWWAWRPPIISSLPSLDNHGINLLRSCWGA